MNSISLHEEKAIAAALQWDAAPSLTCIGETWRGYRERRWEHAQGVVDQCELQPARFDPSALPCDAQGDADFCIWIVESGALNLVHADGKALRFGAGAILLRDCRQPLNGHWERTLLRCIRPSMQQVSPLSVRPLSPRRCIEQLDQQALAPFLRSQVSMLMSHGASLAQTELECVIDIVFKTVEALLKTALQPAADPAPRALSDKLVAAHRYIERNLHRHDLSVADIASGSHTSRAQLYRLFDTQEMSVHATVREQRLKRSLDFLREGGSGRSLGIGSVAHACGFSNPSVFSKLFRERFGITPRQARRDELVKT